MRFPTSPGAEAPSWGSPKQTVPPARPAKTRHGAKIGRVPGSPAPASTTLGRVNARVLIALFLLAVFALGATVLAAGSDEDDPQLAGARSRFEGAVMPEGLRAPDFTCATRTASRSRCVASGVSP